MVLNGKCENQLSLFGNTARRAIAAVGICAHCLLIAGALHSQEISFSQVEREILDGRRGMDRVEVTAKGSLRIDGVQEGYVMHIWVDGSKIREDRTGDDSLRRIRCFEGENYVYWKEDEVPGKVGIAIHRYSISEAMRVGYTIPSDPRLYGMRFTHLEMIRTDDWDEHLFLGTRDRNNFETVEKKGGVIVGEWDSASGSHVRVTLGSEPKPHVIRAEVSSPAGSATIECTAQFPSEIDIGYPKTMTYNQENIGPDIEPGELVIHEEVTFGVNIPDQISANVFSFEGMDIPPKNINDTGSSVGQTPKFWDGEKERDGFVETSAPVPNERDPSRWRIAVLAICAVGVVLLMISFRSKRR